MADCDLFKIDPKIIILPFYIRTVADKIEELEDSSEEEDDDDVPGLI